MGIREIRAQRLDSRRGYVIRSERSAFERGRLRSTRCPRRADLL
jgi:hypothetical protein